MQAIKNGIKCTLRTPGKTALFLIILTVISALLTVSFGVFAAVRGYIDDADGYFHTIAELEYVGRDYPDPFVYDEAVAEAAEENAALLKKLTEHEAVISFEPAKAFIAVSDSVHRWDNNVYAPDSAVLSVHVIGYDEALSLYSVLVNESLYSRKDYTGKLILLSADGETDGAVSLEAGKKYIIAGKFFKGNTSNPWFSRSTLSFIENGEKVMVSEPIPAEESKEDDVYHRLARELHFRNDSVRVTYTSAVEDLFPFHQQILKLSSGRFFTEEEYETKARVCIISERIAGMQELSVGDRISFDVYGSSGDVYNYSSLEKADGGEYEIIGINSESDSFPYRVFMPDKDAVNRGLGNVNGYNLGQFRLKNDKAAAFMEDSAELLEKGFRVNVYDQGYAAATEPMRELLLISVIFLAVCLLMAVCALALQSHLFVNRQRETALTMHALGSGRPHIFAYFLSSSVTLAALASVLGGVIGKLLEGRVFGVLKDYASQFSELDTRFSSGSVALTRTLEFAPSSDFKVYLFAALTLIVFAAALTLVFSAGALREKVKAAKKKRGEKKRVTNRSAKTSRLSGFFKYGLLSVRRGRLRTLAVIVMGVVAAVFFLRLTASLAGYEEQLGSYRENAEIKGYATDLEGHRISGLVLKFKPIMKLALDDVVKDCCVSTNFGHIMFINQVGETFVPHKYPESSFAYETMFDIIWNSAVWTGVSSVKDSPLFHYSKSSEVEWLDGYGEKDFRSIETKTFIYQYWDFFMDDVISVEREYLTGPSICALSNDVMEEYGIKLGDTLTAANAIYVNGSALITYVDELKVVARYTSATKSTEVLSPATYVPPYRMDEAMAPEEYFDEGETSWSPDTIYVGRERMTREEYSRSVELGIIPGLTYSSFTFTLSDTSRLDELREKLLESGFTFIRSGDRKSTPAIIEDEIFLNTTHSMERQIQYVTVLYGALCILAGIIGFVLAWLMTASRRKEIAVMRALGTPPLRILVNFLLEQMLLVLAGLGIGLAAPFVFGAAPSRAALMLSAAFFAVWSVSALICLLVSLTKRSYAALTEPE